jgi:hypothetical protein
LSLTEQQRDGLRAAIESYAFPPDYFDFRRNAPRRLADTRAVEVAISGELKSGDPEQVKNGLSNVLYWGYAQMGIRQTRVDRFRATVTVSQLRQAADLFDDQICPLLYKSRSSASRSFPGSHL